MSKYCPCKRVFRRVPPIFVVMSVLLSRLLGVRSGWVAPPAARGGGRRLNSKLRPSFQQQSQFFHFPPSSGSNCRHFHGTTALQMAKKWNVGETVAVRVDEEFLEGTIQEKRGGGWYHIRLSDDDDGDSSTIIKCRGTQLRQSATTASAEVTVQMFTAPNKTRPVIVADSGEEPVYSPPPPTIHNLDAAIAESSSLEDTVSSKRDRELLKQVAHHASFEKWVVFTDLHCSPTSLDTCLEVLTEVHKQAVERNAGVLFLGDFWHHRGTLRVDCLNAVLEHFRSWEVPMVMIPGNHDQVTLGGHNHGLTPIENAYRVGDVAGPLVLSYTTKFRDALFIPHIRDVATMESILQSEVAKRAAALFVHADVKGAMMNDLIVSNDGIPPASFPPEKLIYSGHFHKPHTVKSANVKIEYLGSPYETSLAEAQQPKMLAILDAKWQCIEYIPLDIGRRHFKVSCWRDLLNLHLETTPGARNGYSVDTVKVGDRVVVTVSKEEVRSIQPAASAHIQALREAGIMVEVREKSVVVDAFGNTEAANASGIEDLTPESTWRKYLQLEEARESITDGRRKVIFDAGLEIVNELEADSDLFMQSTGSITELRLHNVSLEGFGPFRDEASYPLWNRGLVLLKGVNKDGGSDSNGSGKSSLAMAALWALTGSLDPRRVSDAKVSDIVNDDAKTAKVSLEGSVNGEAFTITRTKTASKGTLVFILNGEDLTTQSVKETQVVIEEKLGISPRLLSRTMFHGQHAMNELLEATDASLKDELSLVVPLSLWQKAASQARAKSRATGKKVAELSGMVSMRSEDQEKLQLRLDRAYQALQEKKKALEDMVSDYEKNVDKYDNADGANFADIENQLESVSTRVSNLEAQHDALSTQRDADLRPLERSLHELTDSLASLAARCSQEEREVYAASLKLDAAKATMAEVEEKWSVDLSGGIEGVTITPDTCPTCRQPVTSEGIGHSHDDLQAIARAEIVNAHKRFKSGEAELKASSARFEVCNRSLTARQKTKSEMESDLHLASERWADEFEQIDEELRLARKDYSALSEQMQVVAKSSQMASKRDTMQVSMDSAKSAVEFAVAMYNEVKEETKEGETRLEKLKAEMEEQNQEGNVLSEVAERFGQRGVQTFVLQTAVEALEAMSQTYLDDLSDGAQRLRLSLDAGDRITRTAFVSGGDGVYKERPLSSLSGGQWRRCSLALTFGFAELLARKGKIRPSLCVLDEPLTHLDQFGRAKVGEVIRRILRPPSGDGLKGFGGLGMSTVVVILQDLAAEELDESFDCIDEVMKEDSQSSVKIDELS